MRSCAPKPCSTHAQDPSNYTAICGRVTGKQEVRSYRFEDRYRQTRKCPQIGAVSMGRRNTRLKSTCRGLNG